MDQVFVHSLGATTGTPHTLFVAVFVLVRRLGVEGCEKQVLQNCFVVVPLAAIQMRRNLQELAQRFFVKQLRWHQMLFLQEPNENKARE